MPKTQQGKMGRHKLEQSGVSGLGDLQKSREMPWFWSLSSLATDCLIPIPLSSRTGERGEEETHLGKTGSRGGIRSRRWWLVEVATAQGSNPIVYNPFVGRLLLRRVEL